MTRNEPEEFEDHLQVFPTGTIAVPITWAETAARHSTLMAFTEVMTDEINRHRRTGNHAAARMVTEQAMDYSQTVQERSPYEMESCDDEDEGSGENDPVLGPALEEAWDIMEQAQHRLNQLYDAQSQEDGAQGAQAEESQAEQSGNHLPESGVEPSLADQDNPSYEEYQMACAFSLATARVLDIHTGKMSGTGPLQDGHRQAAQGLAITLRVVLDWLEDNQPPPPSPNPNERTEPDQQQEPHTDFQKQAITRFQEQFDTVAKYINITIHPSLDNDPEAHNNAEELAEEMTRTNVQVSSLISGETVNGHDSLVGFYHQGHIHVKRIQDEYPDGLHAGHAIAIAEHIETMFTHHAMDHEEGWLSKNPEFIANLFDDAIAELHTLPQKTIYDFLDKLAEMDVTQPVQINLLRIVLEDEQIPFRHMREWHDARHPDEAQPNWPKLARTDPGTKKIEFDHLKKILEDATTLNCGYLALATIGRCFGWHDLNDQPLVEWLEKNSVYDLL